MCDSKFALLPKTGNDVDMRTRQLVPVKCLRSLVNKNTKYVNFFPLKQPSNIMPHRCVAGGCSNTAKDGVSLHGWPTNAQLARQWTNAVRNTRANFSQTASSKLCSSHFSEDSFEPQSVISHSLGLNMKKILKPSAVPTIFNNCPPHKKQRRDDSSDRTEANSLVPQFEKQPRGAYRKREAARVRAADYLK